MNAMNIMSSNPRVITGRESVNEAAALMRLLDVGMLPVVDDANGQRLIGVITDRDIVVRCCATGHTGSCPVSSHMSSRPITTVTTDASVREIADKMKEHQVRRLPVVDAGGVVVGVITQADLARHVGPQDPDLVEEVIERISTPAAAVPV